MSFQSNLIHLMLIKSPEVQSLRMRAINGNKETLHTFCTAIVKLLQEQANHQIAYEEISELLISGRVPVVEEVDKIVLPVVGEVHCREDLEEYVIFWRRVYAGQGTRHIYPDINQTLRNVRVKNERRSISGIFDSYSRTLDKNIGMVSEERVEFFNDIDGSSFASDSLDDEVSSAIIEMDMNEIKEIKFNVEKGPVDEPTAEEYLKKVKNFLSLKPKSLKKELSLDFNNDRIWGKEFIQKYDDFLQGGSLNLHQYYNKIGGKSDPVMEVINIGSSRANIMIHQNQEYEEAPQDNFRKQSSKNFDIGNSTANQRMTKVSYQIPERPMAPPSFILDEPLPENRQLGNFNQIKRLSDKKPQFEPNFILDTEELNRNSLKASPDRLLSNSSMRRTKIFQNSSRVKYSPDEEHENLVVINHAKKGQGQGQTVTYSANANERDSKVIPYSFDGVRSSTPQNNYYPNYTDNDFTPQNYKKNGELNMLSPNTAFQAKTLYGGGSTSKKLSELNEEKRQRKMKLLNEELFPIESYYIKPYSQNFDDLENFNRFRASCLTDHFTLYASQVLLITCSVQRLSDSKVRIDLVYQNQSQSNLNLETLYRIPKCLKIEKYSQIQKKWVLQNQYQHSFGLELYSFPLEPCLLNLRYTNSNEDLRSVHPNIISIPVTMRNFLEYLVVSPEEWIEKWGKWSNMGNFRLIRNISIDTLVVDETQLPNMLKELTKLTPLQGYSVQELGGECRQSSFENLSFLLRISQRVENIMTLEVLASRKVTNQDEIDYMDYCLSIWCMLLSKIESEMLD